MPNTLLPEMMDDEYITYQANQLDLIQLTLSSKGLVNWQGINTTSVALVQEGETLQIITAKDLDDQPNLLNNTSVKIFRFEAPYLPLDSVVRPRDIQNLKPVPGSQQTEVELIENVIMKKLDRIDRSHAMTREFILMNMLKGKIMKDPSTVLVNLYTVLSKTPQTLDFALDNASTDVLSKCLALYHKVQDGLKGDVMSGVEVQCSPAFFDALVTHATVKDAYKNYMGNSNMLVEGSASRFYYGQCWFERNNTSIGGNSFIDSKKAHAYPLGTIDTFEGTYSPADMTAYANTEGMPLYVSTEDLKHGKGIELHTESRPTAFCKRLDTLVECSTP